MVSENPRQALGNLCVSQVVILNEVKNPEKPGTGPIRYSSFRFRVTSCAWCRVSLAIEQYLFNL